MLTYNVLSNSILIPVQYLPEVITNWSRNCLHPQTLGSGRYAYEKLNKRTSAN